MKFDNIFENKRNRIFVSQKAMNDCDFAIDFSQRYTAEICGLGMGYSNKDGFFIKRYYFPEKIKFVDSKEELRRCSRNTGAELITIRSLEHKELSCILTGNFISKFKEKNIICCGHTHFPEEIPEEMPRLSSTDIIDICHNNHKHECGLTITSLFQIGLGIIFFGFPSYTLGALSDQDTVPDSMINDWLLHNYDDFVFKRKISA